MRQRPRKTLTIDGVEMTVVQLPPMRGLSLMPAIARTLGPLAAKLLGEGVEVGDRTITIMDVLEGGDTAGPVGAALIRGVVDSLGRQRPEDLTALAVECFRGGRIGPVFIDPSMEFDIVATAIDLHVPHVAALCTMIWHQVLLIALPQSAGAAT